MNIMQILGAPAAQPGPAKTESTLSRSFVGLLAAGPVSDSAENAPVSGVAPPPPEAKSALLQEIERLMGGHVPDTEAPSASESEQAPDAPTPDAKPADAASDVRREDMIGTLPDGADSPEDAPVAVPDLADAPAPVTPDVPAVETPEMADPVITPDEEAPAEDAIPDEAAAPAPDPEDVVPAGPDAEEIASPVVIAQAPVENAPAPRPADIRFPAEAAQPALPQDLRVAPQALAATAGVTPPPPQAGAALEADQVEISVASGTGAEVTRVTPAARETVASADRPAPVRADAPDLKVTTGAPADPASSAPETPDGAVTDFEALLTAPRLAPGQERGPAPALHPDAARVLASMKSPLARSVSGQIDALPSEGDTLRIRLKPQGMGLIEIEVSRNADGTRDVSLRVQNPLVLDAMRSERPALTDLLSGQARGDTLNMDLFRGNQGGSRQEGGAPSRHAPDRGEDTNEPSQDAVTPAPSDRNDVII